MGTPLVLALEPGTTPTQDEPWVTPDLLGYARAEESVDLMSVCRVASQILFILSGRRYGVRTTTDRPVAGMHDHGWGDLMRMPTDSPDWFWWWHSNFGAPSELVLKSPVQSISQVKIDGAVVDPSTYQLYDNRTLIRRDMRWPIYQRVDLPDTEVGTFSVAYQWGQPVPEGGKLAAQVFALELARYINKDGSALPDRVVTVSRQGVTQTMLDPSQFTELRRTGLYFVDTWLAAVNPSRAGRRARIASPETIRELRPT